MWRQLPLLGLALSVWAVPCGSLAPDGCAVGSASGVVMVLLLVYGIQAPLLPAHFLSLGRCTKGWEYLALDRRRNLLLMFWYFCSFSFRKAIQPKGKVHGFHILIFLLIFWAGYATLLSEIPARSAKWFLAKIWYLATFVYMAQRLIQSEADIRKIFWSFFMGMLGICIYVTIKHAAIGFSFGEAHLMHSRFTKM